MLVFSNWNDTLYLASRMSPSSTVMIFFVSSGSLSFVRRLMFTMHSTLLACVWSAWQVSRSSRKMKYRLDVSIPPSFIMYPLRLFLFVSITPAMALIHDVRSTADGDAKVMASHGVLMRKLYPWPSIFSSSSITESPVICTSPCLADMPFKDARSSTKYTSAKDVKMKYLFFQLRPETLASLFKVPYYAQRQEKVKVQ